MDTPMKGTTMKKLIALAACVALALCLAGCSGGNSNEPDYADDEAMQVIASGWEKRSDIVEKNTDPDASDYVDNLKKGVQTEIDNDSSLKDRQFENSQMQEDVLAYLNSLDDQMECLNSYSTGDLDFYTEWSKVYDQRSQLLKKFVDEYGMTVNSKYQSALDELLANGTAANKKADEDAAIDDIVSKIKWETKESYGSYTYTATVKNTSDYDFKDVSLVLSLYDKDGVKTEAYASANTWKKGDKVKFEAYGNDTKAKRIETEVSYYDIDD